MTDHPNVPHIDGEGIVLVPIDDHYVVRQAEIDATTKGGIALPDVAKEPPKHGTVVGAPASRDDIAEGDRVLFGAYAGSRVLVNDAPLLILRRDELLARITTPDA